MKMAKRQNNRRPQTEKDAAMRRVHRVLDLRRSSASEPVPSGARYDRNTFRSQAQRGQWEEN
jgi:hypothetical protein